MGFEYMTSTQAAKLETVFKISRSAIRTPFADTETDEVMSFIRSFYQVSTGKEL